MASSGGLESDPKQTAFLRETNALEPPNLLLQPHCVAFCDLNLSWQVTLEKASRGHQISLSKARAVSPPAPVPSHHGVCPAWEGRRLLVAAAPAPQRKSHVRRALLSSGSGCPRAGLWARRLLRSLLFRPLCKDEGAWGGGKKWVLRAEDLGLRSCFTSSCPGRKVLVKLVL